MTQVTEVLITLSLYTVCFHGREKSCNAEDPYKQLVMFIKSQGCFIKAYFVINNYYMFEFRIWEFRVMYICIIQQLVLVFQSVWPSGVPDVLIFSPQHWDLSKIRRNYSAYFQRMQNTVWVYLSSEKKTCYLYLQYYKIKEIYKNVLTKLLK